MTSEERWKRLWAITNDPQLLMENALQNELSRESLTKFILFYARHPIARN